MERRVIKREHKAKKITTCIIFVTAFVICVLAALMMTSPKANDVVMSTSPLSDEAIYYGTFSIPNANIQMELYRFHDGYGCCFDGFFNGGRLIANTVEDWDSITIGDMAYIRSDGEGGLVLELIEIVECVSFANNLVRMNGIEQANGDVLLCIDDPCSPVMRVYRWIIL